MQTERPLVLSIAGFDPSGGAGVLADVKTFEQLGVYGLAVLTANTLQTADKLYDVNWVPVEQMMISLDVILKAYDVSAIKIGITPNVQTLCKIVQRIRKQQPSCPIIWDPVLKSSSGVVFFNRHDTVGLNDVLQGIHLVTPNLPEYEVLKNSGIGDAGPCAVLLKGGHDLKRTGHDTLFHQGHEICIAPTFADVHEKHGSGCVLSSAIAAYIAKGESLEGACRKGKYYVEQFLRSNPSLLGYHHDAK